MSNLMTIRGYPRSDIQQMLETRKTWTGYLRGADSAQCRAERAAERRIQTLV